jgi:hypothetical protein
MPAAAQVNPNGNSNSQGSAVGQASSGVTGNGSVVRGQARSGTRAEEVQGIHATEGRGRNAAGSDVTGSTLAPNPHSNSQGSGVGKASSAVTGNGSVVRGQARSGTRAGEVQGIHATEGRGRSHNAR